MSLPWGQVRVTNPPTQGRWGVTLIGALATYIECNSVWLKKSVLLILLIWLLVSFLHGIQIVCMQTLHVLATEFLTADRQGSQLFWDLEFLSSLHPHNSQLPELHHCCDFPRYMHNLSPLYRNSPSWMGDQHHQDAMMKTQSKMTAMQLLIKV